MISLIERETTRKGWMTQEDIIDMVSLAESTPGVIAVNSATFVGCKVAGFWGALVATVGVVLPSFIVISSLFFVLEAFLQNVWVSAAFKGIRACVAVLILNVSIKLVGQLPRNAYTYIVLVCVFAIVTFTNISGIWLILLCAIIGIISVFISNRGGRHPHPVDSTLPTTDSTQDKMHGTDNKEHELLDNYDSSLSNTVASKHNSIDSALLTTDYTWLRGHNQASVDNELDSSVNLPNEYRDEHHTQCEDSQEHNEEDKQ